MRYLIGVTGIFIVCLLSAASAEVPDLINYQGYLTDSAGMPVPDGNYSVTFRLYDDSLAVDSLWAEGQLVAVKDGVLNALLGSVVPLADSLFQGSDRWLGVQIGLDPEISPRSRLTSVAYAYQAVSAEQADTATIALNKTVNASELTDGVLDPDRYSAYADLTVEGKIGSASDHVAAGDHTHDQSCVTWIEDTTFVDVLFSDDDPYTVLKSVAIAANGIKGQFKISWTYQQTRVSGSPGPYMRLYVNGNPIQEVSGDIASGPRQDFWTLVRHEGNQFIFSNVVGSVIEIDTSQPVVVEVGASSTMPDWVWRMNVGSLVVEYGE